VFNRQLLQVRILYTLRKLTWRNFDLNGVFGAVARIPSIILSVQCAYLILTAELKP